MSGFFEPNVFEISNLVLNFGHEYCSVISHCQDQDGYSQLNFHLSLRRGVVSSHLAHERGQREHADTSRHCVQPGRHDGAGSEHRGLHGSAGGVAGRWVIEWRQAEMSPLSQELENGALGIGPLHDAIVHDLGLSVVGGVYAPGEVLPSPAELQARFGAARSTIREALRALGAKGLLSSRQRVGTVVQPRTEWHLLDPDVLRWGLLSDPDRVLAEFVQLRRLMEPEVAALAARNRTDHDLAAMRAALAELADSTCEQERVESEVAFHRGLAAATHNDMAAYLGRLMSQLLREAILNTPVHPEDEALAVPRHQALLIAVEIGDPAGARAASLVHLRESADALRSRVQSPRLA